MDHRPPDRAVRSASVGLRRLVDDAVGPRYDTAFLRLDLILTGAEVRCGCVDCTLAVGRRRDEILASLPRP